MLAERLLTDSDGQVDRVLDRAFYLLTTRQPDDEERRIMARMHAEQLDWFRSHPDDAAKFVAVGDTKPSESLAAVDVAAAAQARLDELRGSVIPDGVEATVTRNYGATAAEKANKLIQKLAFATASVILLVGVALGRREAVIVGAAVILTLTVTLFASWAWGFTLNRVSLFALIFSIGILVDDAIVVVENIHRHQQLEAGRPLREIIPGAVDEEIGRAHV